MHLNGGGVKLEIVMKVEEALNQVRGERMDQQKMVNQHLY
jgi:hypothetical protein